MSFTPAKIITSSQQTTHQNLEVTVCKHLQYPYRKPIAEHTKKAFEQVYEHWQQLGCPPWVLDSGCGNGESSHHWASIYPSYLVIGIDRSEKRLGHHNNHALPENCLLLRCDCGDFWRLAEQAQWHAEFHSLLYPNPYPKPQHLQQRWHGHGAFPSLLAISQHIELRTNWEIYAKEFYNALLIARDKQSILKEVTLEHYITNTPITAFERKYLASEHALWRVRTA